jgi:hypothetical protein
MGDSARLWSAFGSVPLCFAWLSARLGWCLGFRRWVAALGFAWLSALRLGWWLGFHRVWVRWWVACCLAVGRLGSVAIGVAVVLVAWLSAWWSLSVLCGSAIDVAVVLVALLSVWGWGFGGGVDVNRLQSTHPSRGGACCVSVCCRSFCLPIGWVGGLAFGVGPRCWVPVVKPGSVVSLQFALCPFQCCVTPSVLWLRWRLGFRLLLVACRLAVGRLGTVALWAAGVMGAIELALSCTLLVSLERVSPAICLSC